MICASLRTVLSRPFISTKKHLYGYRDYLKLFVCSPPHFHPFHFVVDNQLVRCRHHGQL